MDGRIFASTEMGNLCVKLPNGNVKMAVLLCNALYSPDIPFMLLSVGKLDSARYSLQIKKHLCKIHNPQGEVIAAIQ